MPTDTNIARPVARHRPLMDPPDYHPTVERVQYRPLHRVPGEITGDIPQGLAGGRSRLIEVPLPPRTQPTDATRIINAPYRPDQTRVMARPVRAFAPVPPPAPAAPKSRWQILGDALQALRFRGQR